ncbi:(Fe-S)-binding protein [Adlercreutzia murintestinalis]|uniref:(Fe-S)-binding protein n=1 Tax=Adlercreutzia murintestinalis TaxID=2941325 RepID=UPI00203F2433|nr:(Fe-S)-binding protein [Adlercreutzia murintestinalis]
MAVRDFLAAYEASPSIHNAKMDAIVSFTARQLTCSHCGKCTQRCEVLRGPGLDIGTIAAAYDRISALPEDEQPQTVMALVAEDYLLYNALRQCCFCGHCTAACAHHVLAPEDMRAWRQLFMRAGLMPPDDSKLVMVDNEWNIFSAYRAIHGVAYPEYVSLAAAAEAGPGLADTLFFPGCSLVSYAPEVTRAVGDWLAACGVKWALCDGCCGSPLMSAGLFERAEALRCGFVEQMQQAGIRRMVTVCPGCADEFADDMPADIAIVPLPALMLELAERRVAAGEPVGFAPLLRESVTFFDSCHDRLTGRNGRAIRELMRRFVPDARQAEMEHCKRDTLCCGAGGAVAAYDPQITDDRVWQVMEEARATATQTVITMCPTCTYTLAQANLNAPERGMDSKHYLEMLFGVEIDWAAVFANLGGMWTGEYGPWLTQTFY